MFRYRKLFLIFLAASLISGQDFLSDAFFLDLGIVIEPKTGKETNSRVVGLPRDNAVATVNKTHGKAIYMATTSEMFASLDRINDKIRSTEEMLKSKITSLEQENLGLKNQIMDLNQRMEYEFSDILTSEGISSKPPIENPVPLTITTLSDPATVDLPTDIGSDHNGNGLTTNKSDGFDQAQYTVGVIAYQREDYELCLEIFNQLPLDQTNQRTMSNILYWMADAYQQLRDYDKALMMLERLSISGSKEQMDDMLVKNAFIYREQGSQNRAKEVFTQLVDLFPESEYAPLAQLEIKNNSSEK